ncbi:hypothetical protein ACFRFL_14060 [Streptomyces sp. NPDC056708]|uniref:hypothetical protein n=1 Tax=unclassified Streptomyces TaxID=2593676 RepID=UPI0036A787B0
MNNAVKAATRARLLASIVRGRASRHPEGKALRTIARHLDRASKALLEAAHTNGLPDAADDAIWAARLAAANVETGVSTAVFEHITAPVTGYFPELRDLLPANPEHARRANELRADFLDLVRHLDCRDEDVTRAVLHGLIRVHNAYELLADEVEEHGRADARPTTFRPHTGTRSAEHLPGRLTVFDGGRIVAELTVPFDVTSGEIWQLIQQTALVPA